HFLIEEHVTGGLSVHKDPGNFFKWFNSIHRWEWANAIWFSEYDNEGSGNDESIGIRYLDGALGNISGIMIYAFDYNTPDSVLKALQGDLKNQDNFEDRIIRQKLFDVVPLAAALMTSDESYTTRKKEFGFMALDQLQDGKYKTYVKRDTVIDFTGEKLVTDAQKVLTEKKTVTINGKKDIIETPLRVEDKTLREMNVSIPVFSLYEPSYVKDVAERIEKKRSEAMKKVVSIAKTKLENRENYLETVKGKVEIIKKKYEQMAINKKQILAAQTTLDTVRVISETNRDVMRIKKVIAGMKKNIEELKGTKEYRVRQLKVYADNQLEAYLGAYK
ncbi:MAG: hypothetical protein HYW78_01810, partial [Parcubacteria group bacterium]|nr:hypothetical protein [Parcubacteria group bacterium]